MNSRIPISLLLLTVFVSLISAAEAVPNEDIYSALDELAAVDNPVSLKFRDTPLSKVFSALQDAVDVNITVEYEEDKRISVDTEKIALKDALIRLAEENELVYEVKGPRHLIVKDA